MIGYPTTFPLLFVSYFPFYPKLLKQLSHRNVANILLCLCNEFNFDDIVITYSNMLIIIQMLLSLFLINLIHKFYFLIMTTTTNTEISGKLQRLYSTEWNLALAYGDCAHSKICITIAPYNALFAYKNLFCIKGYNYIHQLFFWKIIMNNRKKNFFERTLFQSKYCSNSIQKLWIKSIENLYTYQGKIWRKHWTMVYHTPRTSFKV